MDDIASQLNRLRVLLLNLPKLDDANRFYKQGSYELTTIDHEKGDGTDIGALHHRLEQVFGSEPLIEFRERGEGLAHVVAVLEQAYKHNRGDTRILGRWIQRLTKSAIAKYDTENVTPPEGRRQHVPTKRSQPDEHSAPDSEPSAKKRQSTSRGANSVAPGVQRPGTAVKRPGTADKLSTSTIRTSARGNGASKLTISVGQGQAARAPSASFLALQTAISNAKASSGPSTGRLTQSKLAVASTSPAARAVDAPAQQNVETRPSTTQAPAPLQPPPEAVTSVNAGSEVQPRPEKHPHKATVVEIDDDDDDDDRDYRPPKAPRRSKAISDDEDSACAGGDPHNNNVFNIDSDEEMAVESDGESALRNVEASEAVAASRGGRRGPASDGLKFWNTPLKIVVKQALKWEFKCKLCVAVRTVPRTSGCDKFDDEKKRPPTGNLTTHIKDKHPNAESELKKLVGDLPEDGSDLPKGVSAASAHIMAEFLKEGLLNPKAAKTLKGFLRLFAAWIIDENLPFTTGESVMLRSLFRYLEVSYALPSHTAVRNELARLFIDLHGVVVKELTRVKSRISYATDTWTTRQMVFTFAGTIASFIDDDWNLVERAVDFAVLEDNQHEGIHAGKAFFEAAADRGGANKIFTMDNASVCDVMARTVGRLILARYGVHMREENARIRCMPHVVNIVVQKILSALDEADDPDTNDYYPDEKDGPVHYNPETDQEQLDVEATAAEDEQELAKEEALAREQANETSNDVRDTLLQLISELAAPEETTRSPVKKLRLICTKIVSSPQRRARFRRHVKSRYPQEQALHALMVVRDVATRWNFTHAMMDRALRFPKAIDAWVFEHRDELGATIFLSREDWELLRQIRDLLKIFPEVTRYMSQSGQPTLPWVLPMYSLIDEDLRAKINDMKVPETLRNAAQAGLQKLEYYHELAQKNHYNWLATILHPALRNWPKSEGSGDRARTILSHAFDGYKEQVAESGPVPVPRPTTKKDSVVERILGATLSLDSEPEPLTNEIDRYLNGFGKALAQPDNALLWWRNYEKDLPILARMARDFLAIPASSTSVERLFSESGYLVTKQRSSLSAATIRQCMCTKRWIREGLMKYL